MKTAVITCAGLNHNTSPVEEREALAFTAAELNEALLSLVGSALAPLRPAGDPRVAPTFRLAGAAILSTCNRTELYTMAPEGAADALIDVLNALKGAAVDRRRFYVLQQAAAVEHLYRVACGIDSMVLGESQILGQVRDAMSAATEAGTLNGALSHVFHSAMSTGKRARSETNIGKHAVSVSSAAVALARRELGELENKAVLVISAGSMGKLAAKALAQQPGSRILVANRTQARAADLAQQMGPNTEAFDLDHLQEALAASDIVISGTSADDFILGPAEVAPVMAGRGGRGLLFIDIAVPRDIDPAVREISGVHLCDIDDIEAVTAEGWSGRQAEVGKVEAIVAEEVAAFEEWWRSLDVVPVIAALRDRAEAIRLQELERTLSRMPGLDDDSRRRIEAMTAAIVKKMLDRPIARLKDGADKGLYMEALEDLFDVHPASARRGRP